jgi:pimeloyl-ACP methyl ester carboxylesterase
VVVLRTALTVVLAVAVAVVAACSDQTRTRESSPYEYFRVTVDGQETLGVSEKEVMVRGVVLFFHGMDTNEFAPTSDNLHKGFTAQLVNANFAVVSTNAGGNAFGDSASQQNYLYLAATAAQHYKTENVFFVAESMGAVAAVNLLTSIQTHRFRGLAAINPVLDLASLAPPYASIIAQVYANESMDSVNPMKLPPSAVEGKKLRFYVSRDDRVVPADANALAFRERFGHVADISIVDCSGPHGDPSCFQGSDIVKWFTELEKLS